MSGLRVVGFSGAMNAGKSTAASLMGSIGYARVPFAGPLKRMCRAAGISEAQVYGSLADKNLPFNFPFDLDVVCDMLSVVPVEVFHELGIDARYARELLRVVFPSVEDGLTTTRKVMQLLGTEWGRTLHPDLWTTIWRHEVDPILNSGGKVVADDVRFSNEGDTLRSYSPRNVVEVRSFDHVADTGIAGHASEQVCPGDFILFNSKRSTAEMWSFLQDILKLMQTNSGLAKETT